MNQIYDTDTNRDSPKLRLIMANYLSFTPSLAGKQASDPAYLEMCVVMFIQTLLLKKTLCNIFSN